MGYRRALYLQAAEVGRTGEGRVVAVIIATTLALVIRRKIVALILDYSPSTCRGKQGGSAITKRGSLPA